MSSRSRESLLGLAIILAALGPLLFPDPALAQDKPQPGARKFDEFGDVQFSDLKARLDNFAIQLQQEPGTRGFIIVYRNRRDIPGISSRYALRAKDYTVSNRGIPKERVVTVDGGPAACFTYELWIVDPGAAPKPRADAYSRIFIDTDSALKFDEIHYALRSDLGEYDASVPGITPEELEAFAAALRQHPRARAHVIAYKQHQRDRRTDPPGVSRQMLRSVRRDLIKLFGIAPARIKVADGGHRVWRQVELWLVPPGVQAPVATPSAFPRGR